MLLQIQGYNFDIFYRPGAEITLADTLSRMPNPGNCAQTELDTRVDGTEFTTKVLRKTIALINFPEHKQKKLQEETNNDPVLNSLEDFVYQGWPENIKQLPQDIRPYWSMGDEFTMEAGLLFQRRQVLIPKKCRKIS